MRNSSSLPKLIPLLFGFFIMGFVDAVGIATNYVKKDFALSDTMANLLPMMVFVWFAVFSVPTGLMMNSLGRKKTVVISMIITAIAMVIPLIAYSFSFLLVAFALIGIGNTILQVSLNPLMTNVVSGERLTSSLTLGQFIKAIASFLGPIIAGYVASKLGNWKYMFYAFASMTIISGIWLIITPIEEAEQKVKTSSFAACFSLLKNNTILLLFLGILFVVGVDVGLNTTIPKFLSERCGIDLKQAGFGTSLYFAAKTLGTFTGAIVLLKFSSRRFFIFSMFTAIAALILMLTINSIWSIGIMIFVIGFACANVFPIIFSEALQKLPEKANEISGLMIMGIAGGAVLPPVMGIASDYSNQTGGMAVLFICLIYLLFSAFKMNSKPVD
jgi:MFS transporter, FHS family, L-fucose permease